MIKHEAVPSVSAPVSTPVTLVDEIKRRIYDGHFVAGQRLIEADLALELNAGRGSIREALRFLEALGVVAFEPHRGARVRQFTRLETVGLLQVREVIEGLAASLTAMRHTVADGGRLRRVHEQARQALRKGDVARYLEGNEALHSMIVKISGNPVIHEQLSLAKLSFFRLQTRLFTASDLARSDEEHENIVSAICARQAKKAETAMRQHVRSSLNVILGAPDQFFRRENGRTDDEV
jgi:DNA-binding GntR family transcriptional regulator